MWSRGEGLQEGRCSAGCTLQEDCFAGGALQCSLHLAVKALCRRGNAVQPAPCRRGSLQHGRSTYPAALHQEVQELHLPRGCTNYKLHPETVLHPGVAPSQYMQCTTLHLALSCTYQEVAPTISCTWRLHCSHELLLPNAMYSAASG